MSDLTHRLTAAEEPLLAAHGLTMWEYIVVSRLESGSAPNQLTLAAQIGHDKSRLIRLLDALEGRGSIRRDRDPADRRSQLVSLTEAGRRTLRAVRADIREMETEVLAGLTASERRALLSALPKLCLDEKPPPAAEIRGHVQSEDDGAAGEKGRGRAGPSEP